MKLKTLRPVAAALIIASLAPAAIAETLGQHPAELVARTWATRGIDPNTFIVRHPAGLLVPAVVSSSVAVSGAARVSARTDAQASAAALLSASRVADTESVKPHPLSDGRVFADAQAHAAALLGSSSAITDSRRTRELSSKLSIARD